MVYVIDDDGTMGSGKKKKVDKFYETYEAEMALVTDTKGGDTRSKIVTELQTIETELRRQARAASPEMVLRPGNLSPDTGSVVEPYKPEHWSCFDVCFSKCFYGCFLPDTY
jgi:hypothetical protein